MENNTNKNQEKISTIIALLFIVWIIIFNIFKEKIDSIYQTKIPIIEEGYNSHEKTANEE